jgi:hypothetical protein
MDRYSVPVVWCYASRNTPEPSEYREQLYGQSIILYHFFGTRAMGREFRRRSILQKKCRHRFVGQRGKDNQSFDSRGVSTELDFLDLRLSVAVSTYEKRYFCSHVRKR